MTDCISSLCINSIKHQLRRHLGSGVFIDIWSIVITHVFANIYFVMLSESYYRMNIRHLKRNRCWCPKIKKWEWSHQANENKDRRSQTSQIEMNDNHERVEAENELFYETGKRRLTVNKTNWIIQRRQWWGRTWSKSWLICVVQKMMKAPKFAQPLAWIQRYSVLIRIHKSVIHIIKSESFRFGSHFSMNVEINRKKQCICGRGGF